MTPGLPPSQDDGIERWLRHAGLRGTADEGRTTRVHDAVKQEWRRAVRARARWRFALWSTAASAIAASILVVVLVRRPPEPTSPSSAAFGRIASVVGDVTMTTSDTARRALVGAAVVADMQLRTGPTGAATVAVSGGGQLRVDADTGLRFTGAHAVVLDRGGVYFDSGSAPGADPIAIQTPAGTVTDIGTRFEVRVGAAGTRVRVRDGTVRIDHRGRTWDVTAGTELGLGGDGTVDERRILSDAPAWTWTTRAAPPLTIEGATLSAFLDWVQRESGRSVRFDDDALARGASSIRLHGEIAQLTVDEALATVLPTCGLDYHVSGSRIVISRAEAGGER